MTTPTPLADAVVLAEARRLFDLAKADSGYAKMCSWAIMFAPRLMAELAELRGGWLLIADDPPSAGADVLVGGLWPDGTWWRAIGIVGQSGHIHGDWNCDLEPTHWGPLPAPPAPTQEPT